MKYEVCPSCGGGLCIIDRMLDLCPWCSEPLPLELQLPDDYLKEGKMNISEFRNGIWARIAEHKPIPIEMHNIPWGTFYPIATFQGEPPEESLSLSQFQSMVTRIKQPTSIRGANHTTVAVYIPKNASSEIPPDGADDPFGWAMGTMRGALEYALAHDGSMSEGEYDILCAIASTAVEEDPYWASPAITDALRKAKEHRAQFQASIR